MKLEIYWEKKKAVNGMTNDKDRQIDEEEDITHEDK